jgi:hypothetical protein
MPMTDSIRPLWHWFWRERSGVLLFPSIRGYRRLPFDVGVLLLSVYAWYFYLSSIPARGLDFLVAMFENPFVAIAILFIFAHETGVRYMRDQLPSEASLGSRLALLLPGRVLFLYQERHGRDLAVKVLGRIRFAAFVSFSIGMLWVNWQRIYH